MSEHLYTYIDPPSERDLARAIRCLESDGVIAYPTDLNWAIGCDAANGKAMDRIRQLKPTHPREQPFTLICSSIAMVASLGNVEHAAYRILKKIWPGPFTILLQRNRTLPRQIRDKRPIVGVRIPDSPLLLALVEKLGRPLASTSMPLKPDGSAYHEGWEIFADYSHGLDLLLDLGLSLPGLESTIVDYSEGEPVLVRTGVGDPGLLGLS